MCGVRVRVCVVRPADSLDETVLHVDVGMERLVIVDDAATFDQEPLTLPRHREKDAPIKNLSQQKRASLAASAELSRWSS